MWLFVFFGSHVSYCLPGLVDNLKLIESMEGVVMLSVPVLVAIGSIAVSSSAIVLYRKSRRARAIRQEKKYVIKEELHPDTVQSTECVFREGDTVLVSRGKFKGFVGNVNQVELSENAEEYVTVCLETANGPLPEVINAKYLQNITTQTEKEILTESNARSAKTIHSKKRQVSQSKLMSSSNVGKSDKCLPSRRLTAEASEIESDIFTESKSIMDLDFLINGHEVSGSVTAVSSQGVVKINTSSKVSQLEWLVINENIVAVSYEVDRDCITAFVLDQGNMSGISIGDPVIVTGQICDIPVGKELQGRVIDCFGSPQDGKGSLASSCRRAIKSQPPAIIDRKPVDSPLQTGVLAIDSMIPIGRGQRETIIGDRGTGKTTLAIDAIIAQKNNELNNKVHCVYVSIGKTQTEVAEIISVLEKHDAMEYTTVIVATIGQAAIQRYIAPFAGCTIAEYFRNKAQDALIVYDDLTQYSDASRELALRTNIRVGVEQYPGTLFEELSHLLERAACLSNEMGGGSLTAIPIVETLEEDVAAYIPTCVLNITDGQILLERELLNQEIRPAINLGLSVSRVGGAAQTNMMKKLAGHLRQELLQFSEMEAFAQFGSDLDTATLGTIEQGKRVVELLKQAQYSPLTVKAMLIKLLLLREKKLESIEVMKIRQYIDRLFYNINAYYPDFMNQTLEDLEKNLSQLDRILPEVDTNE